MASCLLRALMSVRVLDVQAQHHLIDILGLENALDLPLQFEEVVLSKVDLFQLKFYGFFNDNFQILQHLFLSLLLEILFDPAVLILQLHPIVFLILIKYIKTT